MTGGALPAVGGGKRAQLSQQLHKGRGWDTNLSSRVVAVLILLHDLGREVDHGFSSSILGLAGSMGECAKGKSGGSLCRQRCNSA